MPSAPPPRPDSHDAPIRTIDDPTTRGKTIPSGRPARPARRRSALNRPAGNGSSGAPATVRQLVPDRSEPCDHLHDTTSRYDHSEKVLSFLLVCPVCKTEKLIHKLDYEPRFEPNGGQEPAGATVHQLRPHQPDQPVRRAA